MFWSLQFTSEVEGEEVTCAMILTIENLESSSLWQCSRSSNPQIWEFASTISASTRQMSRHCVQQLPTNAMWNLNAHKLNFLSPSLNITKVLDNCVERCVCKMPFWFEKISYVLWTMNFTINPTFASTSLFASFILEVVNALREILKPTKESFIHTRSHHTHITTRLHYVNFVIPSHVLNYRLKSSLQMQKALNQHKNVNKSFT